MDPITRRMWLAGMGATVIAAAPWRRAFAAATVREQRPVSGFDQVDWSAIGELLIEQTGREQLSIEAEAAVLAKVVTEVRQRRLRIGFAPGRVETKPPIRFRLEVRSLNVLQAHGSGEVRIGPLATPGLSLVLAGSDDVQLARLNARTLELRLEGAGDLAIVAGQVETQRVVLAGAGRYAAWGLASRQAEVALDGSGDAQVNASQNLVAHIAGSGEVQLRGDARVSASVTGAGGVHRVKVRSD
jgi:hypothetical protein